MEDLTKIILRSAGIIQLDLDSQLARIIATRSRGTPRIANNLLKNVRDFIQARYNGEVTPEICRLALETYGIDSLGLIKSQRLYLTALLEKFSGGPVGLETMSAAIDEDTNTIMEVIEPFLIQLGFIQRTARGRVATDRAWDYFEGDIPQVRNSGDVFE